MVRAAKIAQLSKKARVNLLLHWYQARPPQAEQAIATSMAAIFDKYDTDGDGQLDEGELTAAMKDAAVLTGLELEVILRGGTRLTELELQTVLRVALAKEQPAAVGLPVEQHALLAARRRLNVSKIIHPRLGVDCAWQGATDRGLRGLT